MVDTIQIEMRRGLAEELAAILEHEVETADEHETTEQYMKEGARALRLGLGE